MTEEWRKIPSFPMYSASSEGRIRRDEGGKGTLAGAILSPLPTKVGRTRVCLYQGSALARRWVLVARAVCEAFHGPCPAGHECAHNNGDGTDNRSVNLRWATRSDNAKDRCRHALQRGERRMPSEKLDEEKVRRIKMRLAQGWSPKELASQYSVSPAAISAIRHGKTWSHVS